MTLTNMPRVELVKPIQGKRIRHREVQNHESNFFLSLFSAGIRYLDREATTNASSARLFRIQEKRHVQQKLSSSSLNKGGVFLLDRGTKLFVWYGENAKRLDRVKGINLLELLIKNQTRSSSCAKYSNERAWRKAESD